MFPKVDSNSIGWFAMTEPHVYVTNYGTKTTWRSPTEDFYFKTKNEAQDALNKFIIPQSPPTLSLLKS